MGDVVDVSPEALKEHASAVTGFMAQLSGATAHASDTLDLRAFGVACLAPAQILQVWIQSADRCIHSAIDAGHGIASALSAMADSYASNEAGTRASFDAIHAGPGAN